MTVEFSLTVVNPIHFIIAIVVFCLFSGVLCVINSLLFFHICSVIAAPNEPIVVTDGITMNDD